MNLFDLSGKVAIVTGGNGGIGLGIAQGLAQAGAKVVGPGAEHGEVARSAAERLQAQTGVETLVVTADVSRPERRRARRRRDRSSTSAASTSSSTTPASTSASSRRS